MVAVGMTWKRIELFISISLIALLLLLFIFQNYFGGGKKEKKVNKKENKKKIVRQLRYNAPAVHKKLKKLVCIYGVWKSWDKHSKNYIL